jgi:hypothetical protein
MVYQINNTIIRSHLPPEKSIFSDLNKMALNELPDEIKLRILLNAEFPELMNLCRTNVSFQRICQDERFWRDRLSRDFPDYFGKPSTSWRQLYERLYTQWQQAKAFAKAFLQKFRLVNPRYAQLDVMAHDIADQLIAYLEKHDADKMYSDDAVHELGYDFLTIASGLDHDFIGDDTKGDLDFNKRELDLQADDMIIRFLRRLGYQNINPYDIGQDFGENEESEAGNEGEDDESDENED